MDLWNKIFPNRLKLEQPKVEYSSSSSPATKASNKPYPFGLEKSGVRVLLYRECDRRGRKLLYDSQTVLRSTLPESPTHVQCSSRFFRSPLTARLGPTTSSSSQVLLTSSSAKDSEGRTDGTGVSKVGKRKSSNGETFVEVRNGFGYQYLKESGDTKQIGELVFGSVALAFKGPSSKLHLMNEPSRILLSRTFRAPRSYRSAYASCDTGIEDSFNSLSNSLSEFQLAKLEASFEESFSKPYARTSLPQDTSVKDSSCGLKASQSEEDSGFSGPPSPFSSVCGSYLNPGSMSCTPTGTPSSRNGSGNSLNRSSGSVSSLQRRFLRNVATSLESFGFASMDEEQKDENRSLCSSYQTKLGLAVVIETKQESPDIEKQAEEWWFNQQELLEGLINKLQISLEDAYLHRSKFVSASFQAIARLQQELDDLISAPRLVNPLWLSLISTACDKSRERLHSKLIDSLSVLLTNYDTKQTNFFMSKLLTSVLTHHLGWVSTVGPQISTSNGPMYSQKERASSCISDVIANYLTKALPYNALWGQLCELTGSIGYPSKVTRTVVVGTDKKILDHILVVLSYLIRCSQVIQNHYDDLDCFSDLPSSLKSTDSSRSSLTSVTTLLESNLTCGAESSNKINNKPRNNCMSKKKITQDFNSKSISACVGEAPNKRLDSATVVNEKDEGHTCTADLPEQLCSNEENLDSQNKLDSLCYKNSLHNLDFLRYNDSPHQQHSFEEVAASMIRSYPTKGLTTSKTISNLCMLSDSPSDSSIYTCQRITPSGESPKTTSPRVTPPKDVPSRVTPLKETSPRDDSFKLTSSKDTSPRVDSRLTPSKEILTSGSSRDDSSSITTPKGISPRGDSPRIFKGTSPTIVTPRVTPPRYPDLRLMDDHEEAFGPADIQPEVIAEKVQKLCRVPKDQETFKGKYKPEIKVTGESFDLEIEKGGKVLFTLGEDEKLEGLKPKELTEVKNLKLIDRQLQSTRNQNRSHQRRTSDPETLLLHKTSDMESLSCIRALPGPVDVSIMTEQRKQGKVCDSNLTFNDDSDLQQKSGSKHPRTIYPYHKRHRSDPIGLSMEEISINNKDIEAIKERLETSKTVPSFGSEKNNKSQVRKKSRKNKKNSATNEHIEEWDSVDKHSNVVNISMNVRSEKQSSLNVAESLLGGILNHYSSIFVLHATTGTDQLEENIRADLASAAQHPVLNAQTCEAVAIIAEIKKWEIEVVSSHSYTIERRGGGSSPLNYGGAPVMISPLVSQISDSLLNLIRIGAPSCFVVQCLEHHLRGVYLKSQLLSEYLIEGAQASLSPTDSNSCIGGNSLYNLTELTHTLGIDVNDLPLLLSVASTHTPALTQMFGLTVK